MIPSTPTPEPCPYCRGRREALTCTCRGCVDTVAACPCQRAVDELMAREGLCEGCAASGCVEGLAGFVRCRRLGG